MRSLISSVFLCFVLAQTGCHIEFMSGAKFKRSESHTVDHSPASRLHVEAANGSIQVTESDRKDVLVNAEIYAKTQERLDESEVIVQRMDSGDLMVAAVFPGKRQSGEGCRFEVEIPDANGVELTTSNGSIQLVGLGGEAVLKSSNGSTTIQGFQGSVDMNTSNARVSASNVNGVVRAKTSNGSISIENAVEDSFAATSNGSISVSQSANCVGLVDLHTSNASVKVNLSADFAGQLEAKTSNASISNSSSANVLERGKRNLVLQFGDGGPASRIKTSNGSVTIQQAK